MTNESERHKAVCVTLLWRVSVDFVMSDAFGLCLLCVGSYTITQFIKIHLFDKTCFYQV